MRARMICGVDEAGRGPVMGPLVVCGVAVADDSELRRLGVRDSKRLRPKKREELALEIRSVARVEVVELPAEEIDGLREGATMNELEAEMFAAVIQRLSPEVAYLDAADTDPRRFGRMVSESMASKTRLVSEHKADENYPVVSAASIVAKVVRDARMASIQEEMGEPVGSGYPSDESTMSFIRGYLDRTGRLPPYTRRSWRPAQKIMSMKEIRKLDEFEG